MAKLVEFPDGLGFNVPLFVQCAWSFEASAGSELLATDAFDVCDLVMIDGNHCWAGPLRRKDLAGPLGDSWKDPANMKLLQQALVAPGKGATPAPFMAGPRAEAAWSIEAEEMRLTVRFIYREGPVAAIQGARFPKVDLKDALQKVCQSVRTLQEDVRKQKEQVHSERAALQQRQEILKRRLEILPHEMETHEAQLLDALSAVLNAQKRRCRGLWESTCDGLDAVGDALPEAAAAPTMSLEQCLDREVPNIGARDDSPPKTAMAPPSASLQVESSASMFSLSYDVGRAAEPSFSIPLTLGMSRATLGR